MSLVPFALSEGTLNLPFPVQDCSYNVLKFPEAGITLVITREWNVQPEQVESWFSQQLAKVKRSMKKVVISETQATTIAGLPAQEVSLRFENQHVPVHEMLAAVMLKDHLMAFTISRLTPFDEQTLQLWASVKNNLQLSGDAEA